MKDVADLHVNTGEFDIGHTEFELIEEYTFVDAKGRSWTAPQGTVVNGASIPKVIWSWIGGPWSGRYRNAAVIHDWMCDQLISDSETAHRVFYEGLLANGMSPTKSWVMYQAVLKGGPKWTTTSFGPSEVVRNGLSSAELKAIIAEARRKGLDD